MLITLGSGAKVNVDEKTGAFSDPTTGASVAPTVVASNTAGGTAPTYTPPVTVPTISASSLTPTNPITPVVPPATPTYPISSIDTATNQTATTLGTNEQGASDLTKQIQSLTSSLAGKSTYQTEQNIAAGVPEIQQAQRDLNVSISQLQKEAAQATLTSEDRLAPMFSITGEQAKIERQRSFRALGLSAISDALASNLVSAQSKADQAVALKYGPVEAEQKAKLANLDLILKDPATTLEEKKRALAQQSIVTAQAAQTAQDKTDHEAILKIATQDAPANAANFKSTLQYPTLSVALNAMANAKTPQEASQIQAMTGLLKTADVWGAPYMLGGNYVQKNASTGEIRTAVNPSNSTTQPFGTPTAQDKSDLFAMLGSHPAEAKTIDQTRLQTDPTYFYWVKSQLESL